MGSEIRYRGKIYTEREIDEVRHIIARHPDQSRFFLSKELCRLWNWTQANGTPKDMVCRGLMLFLDREGLITLPPKRRELTWLSPERTAPFHVAVDGRLVSDSLSSLMPLDLHMVRRTSHERLYQSLMHEHHYLGYPGPSASTLSMSPSRKTGRSRA